MFRQVLMAKIMMNHADGRIRSLSNTRRFVDQIINLPRNSLTHNTENPAFAGSFKIDGARLHRVAWIVW